MKRLIKYMTVQGRVPEFVADYEGMPPVSGEYVGLSLDTDLNYVPSTVRIINEGQFREHCLQATSEYETPTDGQHLLDKWVLQGGVRLDKDDVIIYISKYLIRQRLRARGLEEDTEAVLNSNIQYRRDWDDAQAIKQNDPDVRAILVAIGADPDEILAEE